MASVKLTNVKKIYDNNVVAVHDFNLDIKDKEFVVFVGPSGCGKSTTLRMVAGLEEISEGTVEIDGQVVNDLQPKDRNIAMVFQNYALYPHMTVYDNIAFSLRLQKMPEDVIYSKVTNAAEILASPNTSCASLGPCPAASGSVWPSAAPWSGIPRCSSWTSPSPTWTPS